MIGGSKGMLKGMTLSSKNRFEVIVGNVDVRVYALIEFVSPADIIIKENERSIFLGWKEEIKANI